jgi:hypothetical protein
VQLHGVGEFPPVFREVRKMRSMQPVELYVAWKSDNDNPARQRVLDACLEYTRSAKSNRGQSGV